MDADERMLSALQMELERGRDIYDKVKHVSTISGILIGFILTSLSLLQTQTEVLSSIKNSTPLFILISVILFIAGLSVYVYMVVDFQYFVVEKEVIERIYNNQNTDQLENIQGQNNNRQRYLVIGFVAFVEGLVALFVSMAGIIDVMFETPKCLFNIVFWLGIIVGTATLFLVYFKVYKRIDG